MSELELALNRIGRELDYPDTPDLVEPVRRRLAERRRPVSWRRPLVIAVAALVVAVAAVMAVPQARSAILDWLGIGSVTIRYVDELPKLEGTGDLGLGEEMSLSEARERASFPLRVPTIEGLEDPRTYFRGEIGQVSYLYGSEDDPKLVITQIVGRGALEKLLHSTNLEIFSIDGARAAWLSGGDHVLFLPGLGEVRLVGNTLIVERPDGVTTRIEADVSRGEAVRIYRSMR
jgi:hypothetical protein